MRKSQFLNLAFYLAIGAAVLAVAPRAIASVQQVSAAVQALNSLASQ